MLLVQGYRLGRGQPEYEIRGEARGIALDLLVEALGSAAGPGSSWTNLVNNCLIYREMRATARRAQAALEATRCSAPARAFAR